MTEKHTPLPWIKRQLGGDDSFFIECPKEAINKPYGQEILTDDYHEGLSKEADCDFILLACNGYYELKADNERLVEENARLNNLHVAHKEYEAILIKEIESMAVLAHVHGWQSNLEQAGIDARSKILEFLK